MLISEQLGEALTERKKKDLWAVGKQAITSAGTSINIIPSVHKRAAFEPGTVNADIGGGAYDRATKFLAREKGVINIVWDPFTRSPKHNQKAAAAIKGGKAQTATVANVLNVIRNKADRAKTIRRAADAVGEDGVAYFQVYEGDRSGVGKVTPKGWQENRKLETYVSEIKRFFKVVIRKHGYIEARQKEPKT